MGKILSNRELHEIHSDRRHKETLEAIDKAKLSILRGMHSGDKVASLLVNLVEKVQDMDAHTPIASLGELKTKEAWKEAEAYTLRIKTIKESKS